MWMNLHTLPRGTSQYTALIGDDNDADEVDFVAPRNAGREALEAAAWVAAAGDYEGCTVLGLINQSEGYVIFQP